MISPESIKTQLRKLSIAESKPFDYLMMYYFIERILYRLSLSRYADDFILKGGLLLYTVLADDARATRDVDFLAQRLINAPDRIAEVMKEICAIPADDAVRFDVDSVSAERIKEGADYEGVRVKLKAYLDKSRHVLQFDIGFGDAIYPEPVIMEYPSLLDMERPHIRAYSNETVIAEKFEAMIALSEVNSRMKDFYDVATLSKSFDFDGAILCRAIHETLRRRRTATPLDPAVFTDTFSDSKDKQIQWRAFQNRVTLAAGMNFEDLLLQITKFLHPIYSAILSEGDWTKRWSYKRSRWD